MVLLLSLLSACEPEPSTVDHDGDGYAADVDCDDEDRWVHPDSHEREVPGDGVDVNCDGYDACRDLDCDGWPDLVVAVTVGASEAPATASTVWYSDSDGWPEDDVDTLPTKGASAVRIADMDLDGYLDVVFANSGDAGGADVDSVVYWGSDAGHQVTDFTRLPTQGAADAVVADVDGDGLLDLVFANRTDGSGTGLSAYQVDSTVWWGDGARFASLERTDLPTTGASSAAVADLDGDGDNDLVFANGAPSGTVSPIFWNDGGSFSDETEFPTSAAEAVVATDLDGDDHVDLVIANGCGGGACDSAILWGSASGPSPTGATALSTQGAQGAAVADLDDDGHEDVFFANAFGPGFNPAVDSYLYWGSKNGWADGFKTRISTTGASGVALGDLDQDGKLDLVITDRWGDDAANRPTVIHWGDGEDFSGSTTSELAGTGASAVALTPDVSAP